MSDVDDRYGYSYKYDWEGLNKNLSHMQEAQAERDRVKAKENEAPSAFQQQMGQQDAARAVGLSAPQAPAQEPDFDHTPHLQAVMAGHLDPKTAATMARLKIPIGQTWDQGGVAEGPSQVPQAYASQPPTGGLGGLGNAGVQPVQAEQRMASQQSAQAGAQADYGRQQKEYGQKMEQLRPKTMKDLHGEYDLLNSKSQGYETQKELSMKREAERQYEAKMRDETQNKNRASKEGIEGRKEEGKAGRDEQRHIDRNRALDVKVSEGALDRDLSERKFSEHSKQFYAGKQSADDINTLGKMTGAVNTKLNQIKITEKALENTSDSDEAESKKMDLRAQYDTLKQMQMQRDNWLSQRIIPRIEAGKPSGENKGAPAASGSNTSQSGAKIRVKNIKTGQTGMLPAGKFDPSIYEKI